MSTHTRHGPIANGDESAHLSGSEYNLKKKSVNVKVLFIDPFLRRVTMALKEAIDGLVNAFKDLSSLEVVSFSGTLTADITAGGGGNVINWDVLVKTAKPDGKVKLMMASKFECDGDAKLFTTSEAVSQDIRTAHDQAVQAGQQIRKDILDLVGDSIKSIAGLG